VHIDPPEARESARILAGKWLIAVSGLALVAAAIAHHPAKLPFAPGLLGAFDASKLPTFVWALVLLLAFNLAAWAAGGPLRRLCAAPSAGRLLEAVYRLAIGLAAMGTLVFLLAAARGLHRPLLAALLGAGAAAGLVLLVRSRADLTPPWTEIRRAWPFALGAALLLAGVVLGAHLPDYGWDAFTYHLALPDRYLRENGIVVSPFWPYSTMPLLVEMLYVPALALGSEAVTKLLHAELGLLALAAVWVLARQRSRRAAWFSAAVLLAEPLFHWELGVSYNDLGAMLYAVLAVAALGEHLDTGSDGAMRRAALLAGACAATRYTAGVVPLAMLLFLWMRRAPWADKRRQTLTMAAWGAVFLAPWLVRNAVLIGNPVSPALQGVFHAPGEEYFDPLAVDQQTAVVYRVGRGHDPAALLALPFRLMLYASAADYTVFGWRIGVLFFVGWAAALSLPGARRTPGAPRLLILLGLLFLAWFLGAQEPRYLLPAMGLVAVLAGFAFDELLAAPRAGRSRFLLPAAVLLMVGGALAHTLRDQVLLLPYRWGHALGRLSREAFESQQASLVIGRQLATMMDPRDRLLCIYEPRGYFFRGVDYVPVAIYEPMHIIRAAGPPEGLEARLRELGVSYVLFNTENVTPYHVEVPGYPGPHFRRDLQTLETVLSRSAKRIFNDRGVMVWRMSWAYGRP
jgi:hypothetical protein